MSPIALRSLLLAGWREVSTQQAVTPGAKAAPNAAGLAWAHWIWLLATVALAVAAALGGAELGPLCRQLAIAAAPSLAGFTLLPRLGDKRADAALIGSWLTAVTLIVGLGRDAAPAAGYMAPLALTVGLGRPWATAVAAVAVIGYVGAFAAATLMPAHPQTGIWPQAIALASLAFGAGVLRLGAGDVRQSSERRIAEVSHELRTPLTHILGFSELIERQLFGPINDRYVEYAGLIRRSGAHLLKLVNDMLDLSRLEAGRYELALEAFDARAIVEEVVQMSMLAAEAKTIALAVVLPPAPLMVRADAGAVRRILINTVGNALKFTPANGRVNVAARAERGALVLDTIDNGPGMSPAERARLGQAYERGAAGADVEGAGLGLSLVRALAAAHGGTLSFHDAPGGGALVRVTLPVLISE